MQSMGITLAYFTITEQNVSIQARRELVFCWKISQNCKTSK